METATFKISLIIATLSISPDEISKTLGISPRSFHRLGELRVDKLGRALGGAYEKNFWSASLVDDGNEYLSTALELILQELKKKSEFFKKIQLDGGKAELFIGWFFYRNWGDSFSPNLLSDISSLGIELTLDIYPEPT